MGGGSQGVGDLVMTDGPVQVIRPVPEGQLGDLWRDHDPEGLDVGKVIQEQAGDGDLPQILLPRGHRNMLELGPGGIEGQRNEALKPFRLVLELPDVEEVLDLLLDRLDMTVEHGGVRLEPCPVDLAGHLEPSLVIQLGAKELLMHPVTEDLGSAAGNAGKARALEILEDVPQRLFRRPGDLGQLDHGKGLDLRLGTGRTDRPEDVQIVLIGEFRVDPGDHMDLADHLIAVFLETGDDIVWRERVAPGVAGRGVEGAEFAQLVADVGVVDVEVADVVGGIAVHALPDDIGQGTHRGQLRRPVEAQAIVIVQALALDDLLV